MQALVPIAIEVKGSFTNVWPVSIIGDGAAPILPMYDGRLVSVVIDLLAAPGTLGVHVQTKPRSQMRG